MAAELSSLASEPAADAARKRLCGRHAMRRLGKVGGGLLLGAVVTGMTLWAMGALSYSPLPPLLARASGGIARYNWKVLLGR